MNASGVKVAGDLNEMRREIDYYKRRLEELAGESLKLDYEISGLRKDVKQKRQAFFLLAHLQRSIGPEQEIESIFATVLREVNATLGMDKTVVLTPTDRDDHYQPSQWTGFTEEGRSEEFAERISQAVIQFPPGFAAGTDILLVNKTTESSPLIKQLQETFELPHFVCVPVIVEGAPVGLLLSGRTKEAGSVFPPMDKGDIDTFQAIGGLISALVQNRRVARLEAQNQLIQEQTDRKSAFLASMSHELRTPMNAIQGFTNLVLRREKSLSERGQENLQKVTRASDHLMAMINDILDLSKIEAGRMDVNPGRFDVKTLVSSACDTVSPLVKEGVELRQDITDNLVANTDQARLQQMIINLLSNAIKFTDAGSVTVTATQSDGQLVVSVTDTGKGIPADELPTIFDEYRQAVGSESSVQKGTGLGLSITKKFAELLGGSISMESEVGTGSTFTVRVPMAYEGDPSMRR